MDRIIVLLTTEYEPLRWREAYCRPEMSQKMCVYSVVYTHKIGTATSPGWALSKVLVNTQLVTFHPPFESGLCIPQPNG